MDTYQNLAIRTHLNRSCPGLLDNDMVHGNDPAQLEEFWKGAEAVFEKHANSDDPGRWDKLKGAWDDFTEKSNFKDWGTGAGVGGGLGLLYSLATMGRGRGVFGNLLRSLAYSALGAGVGGLGHLGYSTWSSGSSGRTGRDLSKPPAPPGAGASQREIDRYNLAREAGPWEKHPRDTRLYALRWRFLKELAKRKPKD